MTDIATLEQLVRDVGIDTALKLLDIFENDVEKRLAAIQNCLRQNADSTELRFQAHSLKGLCRTYGALAGADSAMRLQDACDRGETDTLAQLAQDVCDTVPADIAAVMVAARALKSDET